MDDEQIQKQLRNSDLMITIGAWVFIVVGLAIIAGGFALMDSEPNWWVMLPFGGGFAGMGYMARRVFKTPEGKKRVVVRAQSHKSGSGGHSLIQSVYVDEDASEDEIAEAQRAWARGALADRADWVGGRIRSDLDRDPSAGMKTAIVIAIIAVACAAGAILIDPFAWFFAVALGGFAGAVGYSASRAKRHQERFATSWLVPREMPLILGQWFEGSVETGISPDTKFPEAAVLTLSCIRTWEESYRDSDNRSQKRTRSETLHETSQRRDPIRQGSPARVEIPAGFEISGEMPATTLGSRTGIRWELDVKIAVAGLDYHARFEVPVFEEGSIFDELIGSGDIAAAPSGG